MPKSKDPQPMSTTLYKGDHIFMAELEHYGTGWAVNFSTGKKGKTLKNDTKTPDPITYPQAMLIYAELVVAYSRKGYITTEKQVTAEDHTGEPTDVEPQLLNDLNQEDIEGYLKNSTWCMQPLYKGRRLLIQRAGNDIQGIGKDSRTTPVPPELVKDLTSMSYREFLVDGELMDDELYYVFDVLELRENIRTQPYSQRMSLLYRVVPDDLNIVVAHTAYTEQDKRTMLDTYRAPGSAIGVVLKNLNAPYVPGRPTLGGTQFKYPF